MRETSLYPIAIIEDRYTGCYSGGKWLAIAECDTMENGTYRIVRVLEGGPYGDGTDAMEFWAEPPRWIAVGNTPDEARAKLLAQHEETKP